MLSQYTLAGHFIRRILLVGWWDHFCLKNCLNSSHHTFTKVLETFLRDLISCCHDSITYLLQMCQLHIYDVNLLFYHILKVIYWIEFR